MKKKLFLSLCFSIALFQKGYSASSSQASVDISEQNAIEKVYLKTPDLSDQNIFGYTVGIRPMRKSGIRLEAEYLKNKVIIHNYGYGGSGLTLSWGGAQEAVNILNAEKAKNPKLASCKTVAILGAGVIGLTTAYELLSQGYEVHLYADSFSPNLTSNVAAGIWSPPWISDDTAEAQKKLVERILDISTKRFMASATSENPEFSGIKFVTFYKFKAKNSDEKNTLSHTFAHVPAKEEAVEVHFDNGVTKLGKRKQEMGLDGKIFMDDLYGKVMSKGAMIAEKHFDNANDVAALPESIIINCTSLGSRELFKDQDFTPIRGQMVYVKPKEGIDYAMFQNVPGAPNYWMTIYPWQDRLIIGGVLEWGIDECVIDQNVIDDLIKHARECISRES